jgi:DNA-binding NarL/FixJ family response regulator
MLYQLHDAVAPPPARGAPVPQAVHEGDEVRRSALARLTRRETEVLALLGRGARAAQIARQLGVSPATVRNHVQSILKKLGVHSQLEAVLLARDPR